MATKQKLKILCIHGYRQNGKTFREKSGSFRKVLKKYAEFSFVTAPNILPDCDGDSEQRGWWFSSPGKAYNAKEYTEFTEGFEESLNVVADFIAQEGPFDGILAFSQGASFLSIICSLKEMNDARFQNFRFAMFVAGFKSRQSSHKVYYEQLVQLPTFHIIGETDAVIPREMSDDLLQHYSSPVVLRHEGGHFIPSISKCKKDVFNFLDNFIEIS